MSSFPDMGHWLLGQLEEAFPVEREEIGADARLKKGLFAFETETYRVGGVGHYCILRMRAMFGLMKMETLVLSPLEKDLPLLNLDRVRAAGKETLIAEFYDTQLQPWPQEAFEAIKQRYVDLEEQEPKSAHAYDKLLYPCSFHKAGKGISARLNEAARDCGAAFVKQLAAWPACGAEAKREKVSAFAGNLLAEGGPAVGMVTRLFGRETAERLILHHMYGV